MKLRRVIVQYDAYASLAVMRNLTVILDLKFVLYRASNNIIEALKLQKVGRHRSTYTLFHVSRIIFCELASTGSLNRHK